MAKIAEMSPIVKYGGSFVALFFIVSVVVAITSKKPETAAAQPVPIIAEQPRQATAPPSARTDAVQAARRELTTNLTGAELKKLLQEFRAEQKQTPYTFAHLKKNADKYRTRLVAFTGRIIEIQEGDDATVARVAMNGSSEYIFWVESAFTTDFVEGNTIDIVGMLAGSKTYESQAGWTITVPAVVARSMQKRGTFNRLLGVRHDDEDE